jgi:nucleoid-associated protein YgaU
MLREQKKRFSDLGEVSATTSQIINEKIERQQEMKKIWSGRRPKTLAVSNKKSQNVIDGTNPIAVLRSRSGSSFQNDSNHGGMKDYWFPMLCAAAVVSVAIWTFWPKVMEKNNAKAPEPIVKVVDTNSNKKTETVKTVTTEKAVAVDEQKPTFDIVRIDSNGSIVIAGRYVSGKSISVSMNKKIVATIATNGDGEFAYAPKNKLKPGNYTVQLLSDNVKSDKVFLYVDEKYGQSMSLLMTDNSSRVLQAPQYLGKGVFVVNQIDYIANKRLVVQGRALPRLRVSMSLDGKMLGMTRVSDHKNFGLGAGVGELKSGQKYNLSVKMHDSMGKVISEITHNFVMPKMTDADETFYVVRQDDCLWVIAKNFLGKGIRFSIIAAENKIANPNLIYPNQKFKIPVK